MKILFFQGSVDSSRNLARFLETEHLHVTSTNLGEETISLALHFDFDLILLDLSLPSSHSIDLIRDLRAAAIETPTLVVSGSNDLDSRVDSLRCGADDFMIKPINCRELMARIYAIVRRSKGYSDSDIRAGEITLKLGKRTIEAKGKTLHLTNTEYNILELLILQRGHTVTKDTLMDNLYIDPDRPQEKILDTYIYRIRKKIHQATRCNEYIETVRGRGFKMKSRQRFRTYA